MQHSTIFEIMRSYVTEANLTKDLQNLETQKVADVLVSSFEVVELTMELEDRLGLGSDVLNIAQLAPKFATLTFRELAVEIAQLLNPKTPMLN
ncbi:MAG: hypothetical protein DYG89_45735 [Caldilinea sp. CFX5]|nr:hypothetical protein [Caldilinea sp. CFX5]